MLRKAFLILLIQSCLVANAQVKIAGHRGGYYYQHAESSFSLFQFIADQFKGDTIIIEIDLRTSKDGTLWLLHDETLDRTSTGFGKINDRKDAELRALRLKTKNGVTADDRIPTFEETLNFIRERNINLMLDIKEPIHLKVLELVIKHNLESRVQVLTFRKDYTQLVSENYPQVLLSALVETPEDFNFFKNLPQQDGKRIAYVNTKTSVELITQLRAEKFLIMADVSEDLRHNGRPLDAGDYQTKINQQQLDILITDFPIEARLALKN